MVSALEQFIEQRQYEHLAIDEELMQHMIGSSEPLFRFGQAVVQLTPPGGLYYVYHLCLPNDTPFYVGKGLGDRMSQHVKDARRGEPGHKCNIIRKLEREGKQVKYRVVFVTPDEREAYEYEMYEIARLGYKNLSNVMRGGTWDMHRRVFASNVPRGQLNYARFSKLIDAAHLSSENRHSAVLGWAVDRSIALWQLERRARAAVARARTP